MYPRNPDTRQSEFWTADTQLMVGIFMISFLYQGHTYYANVINYGQKPPTYFVSIISSAFGSSNKLILSLGNDGFELSIYSPGDAPQELIEVIAEKLPRILKKDVA